MSILTKPRSYKDPAEYPEPEDIGRSEWMFRQLHQGRRLIIIGGEERSQQVAKLMRLGCYLRWLPTGRDKQNGTLRAIITAVRGNDYDFAWIWTRHINHSLWHQVMALFKDLNRDRKEAGRRTIRQAAGTNFNTEVMAERFLQNDPNLQRVAADWLVKQGQRVAV